jgi:phosphatidylserine decarboxylase
MPAPSIRFYNRYSGQYEIESIYGERWLRLIYENPLGRFLLWAFVKRALFSRYYGWRMNWRSSAMKILPFIVKYNLDVDEFAKSPFLFKTFNEFFYRALKKEARPIDPAEDAVVFPADGRHLAFENIDVADGFYTKGAKFSLKDLLADQALAERFAGGTLVISRLCPVDYHRFHFPFAGQPAEPVKIRGPLFSVSPIALREHVEYLVRNKRMKTLVETSAGMIVCLEVGATNVGSIAQTFIPGRAVAKGEEKGLFKFGGSCVITLFERGRIKLAEDIARESRNYGETYARMGDRLGTVVSG